MIITQSSSSEKSISTKSPRLRLLRVPESVAGKFGDGRLDELRHWSEVGVLNAADEKLLDRDNVVGKLHVGRSVGGEL